MEFSPELDLPLMGHGSYYLAFWLREWRISKWMDMRLETILPSMAVLKKGAIGSAAETTREVKS